MHPAWLAQSLGADIVGAFMVEAETIIMERSQKQPFILDVRTFVSTSAESGIKEP
jgi:hypothetical protein